MQRLLASLLLLGCLNCTAQQKNATNLFLVTGIQWMPLAWNHGYSASTAYVVQVGNRKMPVKGIMLLGFPKYSPPIETPHTINYTISGLYAMPGVRIYFDELHERKNGFYVGLMGYLGRYKHQLNLEVSDTNWNTTQNYRFNGKSFSKGFVFEMGGFITLYKKLKGTGSIQTGFINKPENPLPQIANFTDIANYSPGAGTNNNFLIGISFGLAYQIF
jgi:hypothetical protein